MSPQRGILWSQLRIGVLVTLSATALAFAVFFIEQVRDAVENRYTLYFYTFTTQTLRPRAPVWLAGQPVGFVTGLRFEPPSRGREERLRVELSVATYVQPLIQEGAMAQVTTAGLLGEAVVNILPTAQLAEPLRDGGELPTAPELDPFEAARRIRALNDSLKPVADRWRQVIELARGGHGTLSRLAQRPTEVGELQQRLKGVAVTFDTLGAAARKFAAVILDEEVRSSLGRIGPRLEQLADTWQGKDGTVGGLGSDTLIVKQLEAITHTIQRLDQRLQGGRGTLGRLLNDRVLATELARTRQMLSELREELGAPVSGGPGGF